MIDLKEYKKHKFNLEIDKIEKEHENIMNIINKDSIRIKNGLPSNISTNEYLRHINSLCNMCLMFR